ncbi:PAS domain-containing sensor histidine kinase, partial [Mesorhizobium sp. M2C.T.Ca.TU.002.02.1.1]
LVLAGISLGSLIAAAGGLSSPVAMLVLALPFEAWWIGGSRRAALWGAVSAAVAILAQPLAGTVFPFAGAQIAAWHWLVPLAWALTLMPRASAFQNTADAAVVDTADRLEEIIDAVVLRVARHGEVLD